MVFQLLLDAILPYIAGEGAAAGIATAGAEAATASSAASAGAAAAEGAGASSAVSSGLSSGAAQEAVQQAPKAAAAVPVEGPPAPVAVAPTAQGPTPSGAPVNAAPTAAPTPLMQNDWFKLAMKMIGDKKKEENSGFLNGAFNPLLYKLGLKDKPSLQPLGGAQGPLTPEQQNAYTMAGLLGGDRQTSTGLLAQGVTALRGLF